VISGWVSYRLIVALGALGVSIYREHHGEDHPLKPSDASDRARGAGRD